MIHVCLQVAGNAVDKFYLDLDLILQRFRQNGLVLGDIPPTKKIGNKVPWKARLRVVEGTVIACQILDHNEAVMHSGEKALEALYKLGPLYWEIIPDIPGGKAISVDTGKLPVVPTLKKPGS